MQSNITIGHFDADCFYVSAERARFPHLRGVPVGVLGNQGACIIAKSYELKASGVKTGVPIWEAHKLCPDAVYIKRDFHWYEVLSKKMLKLIKEISPAVEYYSIDEFFFDASYLPRAYGTSMGNAVLKLQSDILERVGIPVSIGVSKSKTLAKLASDLYKPLGCCVALSEEGIRCMLKDKPVDEICGVAAKSRKKLEFEGIRTCDEFAAADRKTIRRVLTKKGEDLWWEINGTAIHGLNTTRPHHQVVARGGSVGKATADPVRMRAWLVRNTERLCEALYHNEFVTDRLGLYLSFKPHGCWYGRELMHEPSDEYGQIISVAKELFARAWQKGSVLSHMHIIAEGLQFKNCAQRSLFSLNDDRISSTGLKRLVNQRCGRFALRHAESIPLKDIYRDAAQSYDICDIYGKLCF